MNNICTSNTTMVIGNDLLKTNENKHILIALDIFFNMKQQTAFINVEQSTGCIFSAIFDIVEIYDNNENISYICKYIPPNIDQVFLCKMTSECSIKFNSYKN